MALELVTGYWGQNHVTAEQEADLNAGIFGSGFYVLPVGEKMRAEAVTSNQVRIFDGIFVGYGRQASIEEGGYENVTIENGTAGLLRNDMIVIKYNKDEESGIESVAFDVLKGQTGSTAQDPVPNNQDIRAGAFESEMPLYRVKLNGLAIEAIEPLFTVPKSIPELMQDISDLEDENAKLNSALTTFNTIGFSFADSVGSYYIHAGKLVVGFVNAKATGTVTTMELNDMPEPQNDGYIIEALNSYNGEKYSIAYETDHWSLRADSRQIAADEWLRFPMVYLSK